MRTLSEKLYITIVVATIAAALVFQLFFRYQFRLVMHTVLVNGKGANSFRGHMSALSIERTDRLTGERLIIPCGATPTWGCPMTHTRATSVTETPNP